MAFTSVRETSCLQLGRLYLSVNMDLPELQLHPLLVNYLIMLLCLKNRDKTI